MKMPRIAPWADSVAVFAVTAGLLIYRFLTGAGDFCHPESSAFLQNFTDPSRPLLHILYDPLRTDWNLYQARELASLLDWCDAQFIKFTVLHGCTTFFSIVNALLILATVMVLHTGFRRWMPRLGRWGAALLALLCLFAPASGAMQFFRSAKPAASFGIAVAGIALWSLIRRRSEPLREQTGAWVALGISFVLLPVCDRQGLFAVAVTAAAAAAFLLIFSFRRGAEYFGVTSGDRARLAGLTAMSVSAVVLATLYNLEIAPRLILHYNGYRPSFEYQNVGSAGGIFNFSGGCLYFFDNIGFTIFGIAGSFALIAGVVLVLLWLALIRRRLGRGSGTMLLLLTVTGILTVMILSANLMTARHHLILRPDVIHTTYFMPFLVTLILLSAVSAEVLGGETPNRGRVLLPALAAVAVSIQVFGMILPPPGGKGLLDFYLSASPELIRCLNDPARDPERVLLPYSFLRMIEHFRALPRGALSQMPPTK